MKDVTAITVKVTYTVGLGDLKIPEDAYKQLEEMYETGEELDSTGMDLDHARQWLLDNIKERDCFNGQHEIIDLQEK